MPQQDGFSNHLSFVYTNTHVIIESLDLTQQWQSSPAVNPDIGTYSGISAHFGLFTSGFLRRSSIYVMLKPER